VMAHRGHGAAGLLRLPSRALRMMMLVPVNRIHAPY
jgi:hypothetical protein